MKRILHANWQNLLSETIYNGSWMLNPIMAHRVIKQLAEMATVSANDLPVEARDLLDVSPLSYHDDTDSYFNLDEAPQGVVVVIPLKGTMLKYGTWWSYGTAEIAQMVIEAAGHEKVAAIVIDGDSGGGAVNSIAPIVHAIFYARNVCKKPVIGSVDMSASASIYCLTSCDYLIATNNISSQQGSIGTMWSYLDLIPFYEKEGANYHEVYSNLSEHKNESFTLALEGKYDLIKEDLLDPLARKFQEDVKTFRKGKLKENTPGLLTGKMFFAEEAKDIGLIDEVGNQTTAIQRALEKAKINNYLNP